MGRYWMVLSMSLFLCLAAAYGQEPVEQADPARSQGSAQAEVGVDAPNQSLENLDDVQIRIWRERVKRQREEGGDEDLKIPENYDGEAQEGSGRPAEGKEVPLWDVEPEEGSGEPSAPSTGTPPPKVQEQDEEEKEPGQAAGPGEPKASAERSSPDQPKAAPPVPSQPDEEADPWTAQEEPAGESPAR